MEITFQPVDESSLARAREFSSELYRREGPYRPDEGRNRALAELAAHPELGGAWMILADGAVAGYVALTACYSLEFHGRFGLLDELYIDEEWRGKGLGTAALAFIDEQCRARGWEAVRLEVGLLNLRAQEIYLKAGYRAEDRHLMTRWV